VQVISNGLPSGLSVKPLGLSGPLGQKNRRNEEFDMFSNLI
jgi:hypothetical protein